MHDACPTLFCHNMCMQVDHCSQVIAVLVLQDTVPSVAALQIDGDHEEREEKAEGKRTNGVGCI